MTNYHVASIVLQTITTILVLGTVAVYYRQLRVMSRQLNTMQESSCAQSGLALANFLQAPEVRAARHCVREKLLQKPYDTWSAEDRQSAAMVTANYDVTAALVREGLAPVGLIVSNWGPSIKHCYEILEPSINEHKSRDGADSSYWSNFKWLYEKAKQ